MKLSTCSIVSHRVPEFLGTIATLARRAQKYGMTAPVAVEVGTHKEPIYRVVETSFGPVQTDELIGWRLYCDFTVEHATMQLDGGWTFLGTIEHCEGSNILRTLCSDERFAELDLSRYRTVTAQCDHCQTIRARKDTYLVLSEGGETRQVGKSCLKDYLGHFAAKGLGVLLSCAGLDPVWESTGYTAPLFDVNQFVAVSKATIEQNGWKSRGESNGYGDSTADVVLNTLYDAISGKREAQDYCALAVEKYGDFATLAVDWACSISETDPSNYLQNLRVIAMQGCAESRHAGFLASLPRAYEREQEKVAREQARVAPAGHFGAPDDKIGSTLTAADRKAGRSAWYFDKASGKVLEIKDTGKRALAAQGLTSENLTGLPVTLQFRKVTDNYYGVSTVVKLQDEAGHMFVWFKSGYLENLETGDKALLIGSIKAHGDYQGTPQTIMTRCVLVPLA